MTRADMYEEHQTMTTAPEKPKGYPGRPDLDAASARFRRALARLHKEAVRHDPELLQPLAALVGEATEHLLRLAGDAEAAENTSARHRTAIAAEKEKARRTLRTAARRGSSQAAAMLARLDAEEDGLQRSKPKNARGSRADG